LAAALASTTLCDADGTPVVLGALWRERAVVLVHLRHFGCVLCRHYAARLKDAHPDVLAAGAELVAIGTGGKTYAREFVAQREIPYRVLVDRELTTYALIESRAGSFPGLFRPAVLRAGARAVRAGHFQGRTGPGWRLFGGVHILGPGDRITFAWQNHDYMDMAPIELLLDRVRSAVVPEPHAPP
jgi:hypothetical protein